jgi:hypothetical protein
MQAAPPGDMGGMASAACMCRPGPDSTPCYHPLLPQVGLASLLVRHYTWSGLAEARKVLGGAGPGLLQIPGSVLWAGIR